MSAFAFPAGFRTSDVATNGTTLHVRIGGAGRRSCCCTAMARPATCGCRWPAIWRAITPSSCPTCAAWAFPPCPPGGYDKKTQGARHRRRARCAQDRARRPRHPRHRQHGRLRLRRAVSATASPRFVLIDAPLPGVGPWEEILKNPLLWHFRFGGPDMERLVAGASASISTASGTSSRQRPRGSAKRRASTTPSSTPCRARCIPASRNSPPSTRTRSTTRPSSPRGKLDDAGAGARRREVVRPTMAASCALPPATCRKA